MDAGHQTLDSLADPTDLQSAATKAYVDPSASTGWSLKGNAGTDPQDHFMGTTDNNPVVFRVNNQEKMRLDTNGTLSFSGKENSIYMGKGAGQADDATENRNVFIGDSALYHNGLNASVSTDATGNTAVGSKSMFYNRTGYKNTAAGSQAMYYNTSGYYNTASGMMALRDNTEGIGNVATGNLSLSENTTGDYNIAVGLSTLQNDDDGKYNTACGRAALFYNVAGRYNTALGNFSGPYSSSYSNLVNTTAIGNNTKVYASNTVRIGDSWVTSIGGSVGWSNLSDGRFKTQINTDVPGLDFILKLPPVTFHWDLGALEDFRSEDNAAKGEEDPAGRDPKMAQARREKEQKVYSGFVAQQVEKAAEACGYDFSGIIKPTTEKSVYNLTYSEFVVPLVKAVQQQQKLIEQQKQQIEQLQQQVRKLK